MLSVTRESVVKRHRISITLWCLAMLCASPAMAGVVADWNELAAAQDAPPASIRDDAEGTWSMSDESNVIVAVAMFQAVNTIEHRYEPYREALVRPNGDASEASAALAAAHAVLVKCFRGAGSRSIKLMHWRSQGYPIARRAGAALRSAKVQRPS